MNRSNTAASVGNNGLRRRRWRLAVRFAGLLFCGPLVAGSATGADTMATAPELRSIYLDCVTKTTDDYAGVEFKYTLDEAAGAVRVSRWGEAVDVKFGPAYITYRTLGMALKMTVSINRDTWQFTMLHDGGVFLVTGTCKESPGP